ncbi:hypothetical protein EPO33_02050 [Patescibacteria group bacterium]|nr:MAG: hypothetical protein EPO33_02050 [Patescibacteria group bacterium]
MAGSTADTQFEDFIVKIARARMNERLSDATAREICAGFNDPLPDLPATDEDGDLIKVELVIRLARANGRGELTAERMQEIVTRLTRASERPARVSMGPELIYESAPEEDDGLDDEPLADENDVMEVEDGEVTTVERESDTDPPPPADS